VDQHDAATTRVTRWLGQIFSTRRRQNVVTLSVGRAAQVSTKPLSTKKKLNPVHPPCEKIEKIVFCVRAGEQERPGAVEAEDKHGGDEPHAGQRGQLRRRRLGPGRGT
jgi:hypothetical protein